LEYSEACSVLNIMNGPWIEQPSKGNDNGNFQINLYLFIVLKGHLLARLCCLLIQCGAVEIAGQLSQV
jgi:hypothetical protein